MEKPPPLVETCAESTATDWRGLMASLTHCRRCPRLVAWRENIGQVKVRRFENELYWSRPVPSLGNASARLLILGLAPAAHGANRTGRMFTGDRSGDWLFRALHKAGFANQAESLALSDGLHLKDCVVTAAVHCAPPDNKPTPQEFANCRPYLSQELALLSNLRVIVALGKLAWDTLLREERFMLPKGHKRPAFSHGAMAELPGGVILIGSYHPSQQNTFTGRLSEPMLDTIFTSARRILQAFQS